MRDLLILFVAVTVSRLWAADAYAQTASVIWNLTAPDSMHVSSISGAIVSQDQTLTSLFVPASGSYTTNSAQRTSSHDGGADGAWPNDGFLFCAPGVARPSTRQDAKGTRSQSAERYRQLRRGM